MPKKTCLYGKFYKKNVHYNFKIIRIKNTYKKLLIFMSVIAATLTVMIYISLKNFPHIVEYPHMIPFAWKIPYTIEECGGPNFKKKTLDGINKIRIKTKKRYKVFSGYRSKKTNEKAGGVSNSQHLNGIAVDLWVPIKDRSKFYNAAKSVGFSAFGWGNKSVHIDFGRRRWWTYDDEGNDVGGKQRCKFIHKAPQEFKKDFKACL